MRNRTIEPVLSPVVFENVAEVFVTLVRVAVLVGAERLPPVRMFQP
jgi:hypothetical protein